MKVQLSYESPETIKTDLLVVILDKDAVFADLGSSPLAARIERLRRDYDASRLRKSYFAPLDEKSPARHLAVYSTTLDRAHNVWENLKTYVAHSIRLARDYGLQRVSVALNTDAALPFVGKAVEGALLGAYTFGTYKKDNRERGEYFKKMQLDLVALRAHDSQNKRHLKRYTIVADAVNLAREWINEPGSVVTPQRLVAEARKIARESRLDLKVWDARRLGREGYNGLLQVGRGSSNPPHLIRLAYKASRSSPRLAFVGKGVTFDTGGISLKPPDKMWEMKGDMSGAAAVLAAMKAIGQLKPNVNVVGIVPTAENAADAKSQLPGDIFFARNGKSIMVDNTDAEGRLILTDGLHLAGEEKATHIVDIATLTGSCVRALGTSIAGVMGNSPELIQAVIQSGRNHGENFWELPLPEEYKEMLKTDCADLNNIGGTNAGVLTAGLFLQEFVPPGAAWAHLDIAGPFIKEKEWKYYEAGGIGFGTKTLVDLAERFDEYFG